MSCAASHALPRTTLRGHTMTTTQQDLLAHDVHPQELRVTLLAVRYRFAGADARRAIREEIDGMQSEHRCQFGMAIAEVDPEAARLLVPKLNYPADQMRVLCALAASGGVGVSTRLTELDLARAITEVRARVQAVAALAAAIQREDDWAPRACAAALDATVGDLAQITDDVQRADSIADLAPVALTPERLPHLLAFARQIERGDQRAEALIALATHLPPELESDAAALLDESQAAAAAWWNQLKERSARRRQHSE